MNERIFNVLFISVFTAMLGMGIVAPLLPFYAESLGATGIWLGVIFSAFSISRLIFMPAVGRISDKTGRKIFIVSGLLIYSLISVAYVLAKDIFTLTFIRFIHGFASAMVVPVAMAYIGEISPYGKEGEHMGSFTVSLFLGMGFGPFLGGIIKDAAGMDYVFYAMALLTAFSFSVCLLFLPEKMAEKKRESKIKFNLILKNRLIGSIFLFRFLYAFGRGGIFSFIPILASGMHLNATQIGIIITLNILLTALLQKPFGKLADIYSRTNLIISGLLISALTLTLLPLTSDFLTLTFLSCIIGAGGAVSIPAAMAVIATEGRTYGHGSLMGLFNSAMSLGMITGPLVSGWILDITDIDCVFFVTGLLTLAGTLLLIAIQRDLDV